MVKHMVKDLRRDQILSWKHNVFFQDFIIIHSKSLKGIRESLQIKGNTLFDKL